MADNSSRNRERADLSLKWSKMVLPNDVGSGGKDTIDNTVDLCPNCHRKMHVLDLKGDKEKLNATGRIVEKLR